MGFEQPRGRTRKAGSQHDTTRDGQAISFNRPPRESLRPWVSHIYGIRMVAPEMAIISCGIFSDSPMLRVLLDGDWHADDADGSHLFHRQALFFGPQSRRMPVSVRGSFATVGLALKPGACHALGGPSAESIMDRILPYPALGWDEAALMDRFDPAADVAQWMDALEDCMEALVAQAGGKPPNRTTERFYRLAFEDPSLTVTACADRLAVDKRKLERVSKRDFGLSPKQVLRRARALDMAAHLRGVADLAEAQELALRYFDQSHLIRDFSAMFAMTPMQFVRTPQPLMTITLEARQARRLEALDRLEEGKRRPWQ
ncbi:helix-turn-helix domain-containing protein [Erythrobacter sp. SDW2]|uniref:helix-turn-helix transcriptional regulator n=1 Tax=Erythrobacter sp. SDW2 TaxID=2907154 RepID=UPI001F389E3B|nr:helix-turn-helix domain-containing protein [Erythrobacter sp. SDW2]UIP07451.1 helix-turn-helix domain-containing protein [Erythrobacter sp. SDW2]